MITRNILSAGVSVTMGMAMFASSALAVLPAASTDLFIGFRQAFKQHGLPDQHRPGRRLHNGGRPEDSQPGGTEYRSGRDVRIGMVFRCQRHLGRRRHRRSLHSSALFDGSPHSGARSGNSWPLAPNTTSQRSVGNAVKNLKSDYRNFGNATANSAVATKQDVSAQDFAWADYTARNSEFWWKQHVEHYRGGFWVWFDQGP